MLYKVVHNMTYREFDETPGALSICSMNDGSGDGSSCNLDRHNSMHTVLVPDPQATAAVEAWEQHCKEVGERC